MPKASEDSARNLRKLVDYLELLGLPWSIWQTFARFRKDCQEARFTIEIEPYKCPSPQVMTKMQLSKTIQSWKGVKPFQEYCSTLMSNLSRGKDFTRYVHCEIQLLQLFKSKTLSGEKHSYIGCSKGSCYICWVILRDQDFRTERSHHKVSANYEFPSELSPEMGFLPDTLFRLHKEWMTKILRSATGRDEPPDKWEKYQKPNDTQPMASQPAQTIRLVEQSRRAHSNLGSY